MSCWTSEGLAEAMGVRMLDIFHEATGQRHHRAKKSLNTHA
jgi:hypothetical protein